MLAISGGISSRPRRLRSQPLPQPAPGSRRHHGAGQAESSGESRGPGESGVKLRLVTGILGRRGGLRSQSALEPKSQACGCRGPAMSAVLGRVEEPEGGTGESFGV